MLRDGLLNKSQIQKAKSEMQAFETQLHRQLRKADKFDKPRFKQTNEDITKVLINTIGKVGQELEF